MLPKAEHTDEDGEILDETTKYQRAQEKRERKLGNFVNIELSLDCDN